MLPRKEEGSSCAWLLGNHADAGLLDLLISGAGLLRYELSRFSLCSSWLRPGFNDPMIAAVAVGQFGTTAGNGITLSQRLRGGAKHYNARLRSAHGIHRAKPSVAYSYGYRPCHRYQVEQNRLVSHPPVNERYSAVVLLLALPASGADTRLRGLK